MRPYNGVGPGPGGNDVRGDDEDGKSTTDLPSLCPRMKHPKGGPFILTRQPFPRIAKRYANAYTSTFVLNSESEAPN
jgi:hypothetical protein